MANMMTRVRRTCIARKKNTKTQKRNFSIKQRVSVEETRRKAGKFIIFCLFMPRPARLNSLSSAANIPSHAKIVQQWWRVDVNWTSIRDELMERVFYNFLQFSEIPLSNPLKFCLRQREIKRSEWIGIEFRRERDRREMKMYLIGLLSPLSTQQIDCCPIWWRWLCKASSLLLTCGGPPIIYTRSKSNHKIQINQV